MATAIGSPRSSTASAPTLLKVQEWEDFDEGEMFTDADVRNANKVCVVGTTIKRELFQGESPIGKELRIKNVSFRVVGVLSKKGANMMGMDQDDVVLAPWTTIKYRVSGTTLTNTNQSRRRRHANTVNTLNNLYPSTTVLYPAAIGHSARGYAAADPLRQRRSNRRQSGIHGGDSSSHRADHRPACTNATASRRIRPTTSTSAT